MKQPLKILLADDDPMYRRLLQSTLQSRGYETLVATDGTMAWDVLQTEPNLHLAILDWQMPGCDGTDLCRRLRAQAPNRLLYIILLTGRTAKSDIIEGLGAGADDYLTKPFDRAELIARLQVGRRVLDLQRTLADRVQELETVLIQVRQLHGLLPMCSYCKSIRDDHNYWRQVEDYIGAHAEVHFSHGICPSCFEKEVAPQLVKMQGAGV